MLCFTERIKPEIPWQLEMLDKRMVLLMVMPQIISKVVQLQKFHQHQIKVNLFNGSNLRSVQPSPCHLVNIITVQHQMRGKGVLLIEKDVLVLDGQKLLERVRVGEHLTFQAVTEGISAHHLFCLLVELAIDENQRLFKI